MDPRSLRREYDCSELTYNDLDPDPLKQFELWFQQACEAAIPEPNGMVLATVAQDAPTQRSVLLKYFDHRGFVFFTNYSSRKAQQIEHNQNVCILFPWYPLQRQVEINGRGEKISTAESLKYFVTRPRGAQLGAWASPQSSIIKSPGWIRTKLDELANKFAGEEVPLPAYWGGYRVVPQRFEFWQGRPDRLHDRFQYVRETEQGWQITQLAP